MYQQVAPQLIEQPRPRVVEDVVLVNRNEDTDSIVMRVHQNNFGSKNNITNVVEHILIQNGLNVGFCRLNFVFVLIEYVLQTKLINH